MKKIPTSDGVALVFYTSVREPVECALQIARQDVEHRELQLRMGIHSGLVSGVVDVNERANVAGTGINMAQRVMDCGNAGHILMSQRVAEDLEQYEHWRPYLHDLGEVEVKHGVRLHLVNLYTEELGNRQVPEKFKPAAVSPMTAPGRWPPSRKQLGLVGAILLALALGLVLFRILATEHRSAQATSAKDQGRPGGVTTLAIPEKSIAVLPFENLSSDKENAYFADGIQDEILTRLSKIADLKVILRTSTQHYKSAPDN